MNIWANAVITDKGLALQAKLIAGNTLNITRAVTAAGYVTPGLLQKQTDVTSPMQDLKSRPITYPEPGKCALTLTLTNEEVEIGYTAMQVGIYATDPDEGEILYFIAQAEANTGTIVPSKTEMGNYNAEWTFYFQYGQADGVTVTVDPANAVSRAEMESFIDETFIPITFAEIDEAFGTIGGDISGEGSGSGTGTGGVATLDHSLLYNREAANQHTIGSITGLEDALNEVEGDPLAALSVETAWESAT